LIERAKSLDIELREGVRFSQLHEEDYGVSEIALDGGKRIAGDFVVMAVGAWTPYLLPFTKKFFRASGQPVFHLKPRQPELFAPERFPVFGADITTTGYYGFPIDRDGVVKVAPVLGESMADAVEEKPNPTLQKVRWRPEVRAGSRTDVARLNPQTPNAQRRTSNVEIKGGEEIASPWEAVSLFGWRLIRVSC